jgi:excisionase family DNA binding protein
VEVLFCSVGDAAKALGLGRSKTYQLIGEGELTTVQIGRRRLIRIESLRSFAEKLAA